MKREVARALLALSLVVPACSARRPEPNPKLAAAMQSGDALAIADALETLVEDAQDTQSDRELALQRIESIQGDSAAYHFARASVAGRVIQGKGLLGAPLLVEAETEARRSAELDPDFRDGAATRMLGTLYVVAPARLLKHGDSEVGLEMLEGLTDRRPDVMENHLRLAEAYLMLHDPDPARPHLCTVRSQRSRLRRDDQRLLDRLIAEAGTLDCE